jgi:chorismate synthase
MHFSFRTAGESHGPGLVAIIEGVPAGLELLADRDIDGDLHRRQGGHGRGGRMEIEQDRAELMGGVRLGETMGGPIALLIRNRDWDNWRIAMAPEPPAADATESDLRRVHLPRPGHADLVGVLKYSRDDARDILERASARETAARVAAGAIAKRLLAEAGITVGSHITRVGDVVARPPETWPADLNATADASPLRTLDRDAEARMIAAVDAAKVEGDTLGGVFEVVAQGVVAGLGSYVSWDRRLDGRLAGALMSIPAMKGVEVGLGFEAAARRGSRVHDEIHYDPERSIRHTGGYKRPTNHAGGLEGGITTGAPIVVRVAMKPLSSLMRPLDSVDLRTKERAAAIRERSDVAAIAAAGVVGEAMVAMVLADALLEKFGGDSMAELLRNLDGYQGDLARRGREIGRATGEAPFESGAV